jgi:Acyl-CoA synthetases (AMP-forming)/AMP-acid ligases II
MARTWLDVLEEHALLTPQHIALTLRSHQITYAGFLELVQDTAVLLQEMEIKAGDRVALLAPARPEAMITFLACCKIGAIWVSLNRNIKKAKSNMSSITQGRRLRSRYASSTETTTPPRSNV